MLLEIQPDSLAASAGLLTGDVLIGTAGQFFQTTTDLAQALWQLNPGDTLQLDFLRGGDRTSCQVQILGGQSGASAA